MPVLAHHAFGLDPGEGADGWSVQVRTYHRGGQVCMYDLLWDASTSQREHYIRMVTSRNYKVAPTLIVTVTYLGDRARVCKFRLNTALTDIGKRPLSSRHRLSRHQKSAPSCTRPGRW